jgi:hypothetical protein
MLLKGKTTDLGKGSKKAMTDLICRLDKVESYLQGRWNWLNHPLPSKELLAKRRQKDEQLL